MNSAKHDPVTFDLDFDDTKSKELEQKLLSGEITFEEWKNTLQEDLDKKLSQLD